MDAQIVGNKIAELRKSKGMTQAQLADKLSLSRKAISKWETGRSLPDIALLPKIAAIFKMTVDELISGSYHS